MTYSKTLQEKSGNQNEQLEALRNQLKLVQEETEDYLRTLSKSLDSLQADLTAEIENVTTSLNQSISALEERVSDLESAASATNAATANDAADDAATETTEE